MENNARKTMQLRTQWSDDLADGLTTLPFHEYAQELRPVYSEMYQTKDLIEYTDGTHGAIDADGILRDVGPVNVLIANEREYRAEAESAFTQAVGYAALGTFGFLFALLLIP